MSYPILDLTLCYTSNLSDFQIMCMCHGQVSSCKYPRLKEVDDVLGGAAAWENVDTTDGELVLYINQEQDWCSPYNYVLP